MPYKLPNGLTLRIFEIRKCQENLRTSFNNCPALSLPPPKMKTPPALVRDDTHMTPKNIVQHSDPQPPVHPCPKRFHTLDPGHPILKQFSMMSVQDADRIFFMKKNKDWASRSLSIFHPSASNPIPYLCLKPP